MDPDYIVIRCPGSTLDGKWFDLGEIKENADLWLSDAEGETWTFIPTPDIEVRRDGAVAQVFILQTFNH